MTAFEYPGIDQRFNLVFNQAMSNHTTLIMKKILDVYQGLEGLKVLVDVGGGIGVTLNIITSKYPQIMGINFDLLQVVSDAPSYPVTIFASFFDLGVNEYWVLSFFSLLGEKVRSFLIC